MLFLRFRKVGQWNSKIKVSGVVRKGFMNESGIPCGIVGGRLKTHSEGKVGHFSSSIYPYDGG